MKTILNTISRKLPSFLRRGARRAGWLIAIAIFCHLQSTFSADWKNDPFNISPGNTESIIDMWANVNTNFHIIADGSGTNAIPNRDDAVTSAHIANGAVSSQKLAQSTWQAINDNTLNADEADTRYVNSSGDTIGNDLIISNKLILLTPFPYDTARANLTYKNMFIGNDNANVTINADSIIFSNSSTSAKIKYNRILVPNVEQYLSIDNNVKFQGNLTVADGYQAALPADSTKAGVQIATMDDIQSPYDCVIPDNYDGIIEAIEAGKTSIYVRSGTFVSVINDIVDIDHDIIIQGNGHSSHLVIQENNGLNETSEKAHLNIIAGKQLIIRDVTMTFTNASSDCGFAFGFYGVTNDYNLLIQRSNINIYQGSSPREIRYLFMAYYCQGNFNISVDNCNIISAQNTVCCSIFYTEPGYNDFFNKSKFVMRDCYYQSHARPFRIIYLSGFNTYLNNVIFDISKASTVGNCYLIYPRNYNKFVMTGCAMTVHDSSSAYISALVVARGNNTFINNSVFIDESTIKPERALLYCTVNYTNVLISSCYVSGQIAFGEWNSGVPNKQFVTDNIIKASMHVYTNYSGANSFEFHNNLITNIYTP